jgi:GNAT superfamily N-acetyltransferase
MPLTPITVASATGGEDLRAARALFQQYRLLAGGGDLENVGIAEEIAGLPWVYQRPYGDLLVARVGGVPVGCIALRTRAHREGELKRLFVLPGSRGAGVGRALATTILKRAWSLGMVRVCLDTLPSMVDAQSLCLSLGFKPRLAYGGEPGDGGLFFEIERPHTRHSNPFESSRRSMCVFHRFNAKYALVLRSLRHHVDDGALTMEGK